MNAAPPGLAGISPRAVLTEQVRVVYSMLGQSAWMTLVLSGFVAFVLRGNGPVVWAWLAIQAALKLGEQAELRWFYDPAMVAARPERMLRRLYITQSLHAAGWASILLVAGRNVDVPQFTFVVMALGGVLSGGVTTYGALPRVHAVYIATFITVNLFTFAYLLIVIPDKPAFYYMPLLSVLYCVGTYMNTRVSGETYYRHIALGFANAELARSLAEQVDRAEQARHEAEAANAAKSTFLASASHDLRQPVHAAGLFLALLGDTRLTPEQRDMLANARRAMGASSEMLDALLDFSRAEAGVIVPQVRTFAIDDLLNEIERELGFQADDKRIAYRLRESGAWVASDPALVRLILLNLVTNAIRYTPRGGLLVGSRRRGGQLVIEVWDSGIGIAPGSHEAIFADFTQIANPERDRHKGLGLGLAIARRIARLIGSDVTLASRLGRGSVFRFSLPLAPAQLGPIAAGPVAAAQVAAAPVAADRASGHLLVLDDDPAIRQGVGALLAGAGYSVAVAETIEEAMDRARERAPDLLICDFRLRQERNGLEAVQRLRERHGDDFPAIMITGDTHPDRIAVAEREDLTILYKPVEPQRILFTIAQVLVDRLPHGGTAPTNIQDTGTF